MVCIRIFLCCSIEDSGESEAIMCKAEEEEQDKCEFIFQNDTIRIIMTSIVYSSLPSVRFLVPPRVSWTAQIEISKYFIIPFNEG